MKAFYIVGFLVLMAFDTLAQVCFKFAGRAALPVAADLDWVLRVFGEPWAYGAILGYLGAFFTWLSLLRHAPVGPAFAATHLQVVSVLFVSAWLFHEPVTLLRGLGAALILAGIVCLGCAGTDTGSSTDAGNTPQPAR